MFEISQHYLTPARHVLSPNHSARPGGVEDISLIVIHNISLPPNEFGGPYIEDLFLNRIDHSLHPFFATLKKLEVSSHLLIRRDGAVIQFVPFDQRAFHAGQSTFQGRSTCNDFSIGIELEGADHIPFENAQYECLAQVTAKLLKHYPAITTERITGHCDIAPGRKTDPGPAFDWQRLWALLAREQSLYT